MLPSELLEHVIVPVLYELKRVNEKLDSTFARALMLGTAMTETSLMRITQIKGPALSYFQIEPSTAIDVVRRAPTRLLAIIDKFSMRMDTIDQLASNQHLACCIARLKYWYDKEPMPTTTKGLTEYYKRIYNTPLGKANINVVMDKFASALELVEAEK